MREQLRQFHGRRITVQGIFDRFVKYLDKQTALFQALEMDSDFLCSHTYVQHAENLLAYELRFGERVQFSATVIQYRKRREWGPEFDYGLSHPTQVQTLDRTVSLPSLVTDDKDNPWKDPRHKMSRTNLAAELERLAVVAGGYDALRSALDFLRQ